MLEVFTSYHARAEKLNEMGFAVISISVGWPKYAKAEWYAGKMPELAPTGNMLRMSHERYYQEFDKILAKTNQEKVLETMEKIARHAGSDKVALLCFEADCKECHRSYVANWLGEVGVIVPEVEFWKPNQKPVVKDNPAPKQPIQFSLF